MSEQFPDRLHNHKRFYERRKFLRNNATKHERILWDCLKGSRTGFKFRRQHSVGPYILDFYCPSRKVAVELDGNIHNERREYDTVRDSFLESAGITVLRFWNKDVESELRKVLDNISTVCNHHPQPPP